MLIGGEPRFSSHLIGQSARMAKNQFGEPSAQNRYLDTHAARLLSSYRHWTGQDLLAGNFSPEELARELFHAPFAILSHDTEPDPILNYANKTALRLFELSWDELVAMPSRLTAQAPELAERARLLSEVSARGYISDYRGIRISKSGRRFLIERATVWNLIDDNGTVCGQAAALSEWHFLD
jgi:hypothetical protein